MQDNLCPVKGMVSLVKKIMKLTINKEDYALHLTSHFAKLITKELKDKEVSLEQSYQFIFDKYNEYLVGTNNSHYKPNNILGVGLFETKNMGEKSCEDQEEVFNDAIFALICHMSRECPFLLYATIVDIAKRKNLQYLLLFVFLEWRMELSNKGQWGSLVVFGKKDNDFILSLLKEANNADLLVDYKSISSVLSGILRREGNIPDNIIVKKVVKEDFVKSRLEEMESNLNNLDYILFEDPDEYLNYFNIFKKNIGIDYKKEMLSEEFRNYVEDSDFDESSLSNFEEFFQEYLESLKLVDLQKELCEKIIKEEVSNIYMSKKDIVDLNIGVKGIFE